MNEWTMLFMASIGLTITGSAIAWIIGYDRGYRRAKLERQMEPPF
jgi:membrane protein YqaA with SNARE-associated domain